MINTKNRTQVLLLVTVALLSLESNFKSPSSNTEEQSTVLRELLFPGFLLESFSFPHGVASDGSNLVSMNDYVYSFVRSSLVLTLQQQF